VTVLLTALQKVYMLPGDLHGGRFHTLGPVCSLFYGGFLQPIQLALGYKRISNKKVEKTFEQASILVLRVLREAERAMYDVFLYEMERDNWYEMAELIADMYELATYLADELEKWIDRKLQSSTDKMFKFRLNFIKVARCYRLFGEAIRSGSVITIEHLWVRFCWIWKLLGKRIYVEIALNQIEDLYDRADYWLLQTIQDNRTARFHDGETKDGAPLSQWSIDGMIENLQKRYKNMQFKNTEDEWVKHSVNMPFVSMCITFVNSEYGKRYDVESMDEWN
jgi:hypothetical protein